MSDPALESIPINALHASSIRAMSEFIRNPSPALAEVVMRLLHKLGQHPARFIAPCGYDVYDNALAVWRDIAADMAPRQSARIHAIH